ncbi:hypothetical protein D3C80_1949760 [compost metagenome]
MRGHFVQGRSDPGIGQRVDDQHLVAAIQQFANQGRADEAGAAGDQYPHKPLLWGAAGLPG